MVTTLIMVGLGCISALLENNPVAPWLFITYQGGLLVQITSLLGLLDQNDNASKNRGERLKEVFDNLEEEHF